jgi:hypothetical protein
MNSFIVAIVALLAQTPAPSASISGTVTTTDTPGRPLARVVVTLTGTELRPALTVITDTEGRFAFTGLPAGRFTLTAAKPPYLTVSHGQTNPGLGSGVPIAVEAGAQIAGLTVKMPRGAVITGKVLDDFGRPLPGAVILPLQPRTERGETRLIQAGPSVARTDGQGIYRAYGLAPGEYTVIACPPGDYRVIDASCGAFGGGLRRVQAAEIEWARQQLRATDQHGSTRKNAGSSAPRAGEPAQGRTFAYAGVFYPGTTDESAAQKVTLGAGEERDGIDFTLQPQPTARIEGRVVGPSGEPVTNARLGFGPMAGGVMSAPSADGTFSHRDLLPGRYWIDARADGYSTRADFVVAGEDITDLVLTLGPSLSLTGRVVLDAANGKPPADLSAARVMIRSENATVSTAFLPTTVNADGTFRITPVVPGRYRMTASFQGGNAATRWMLSSVLVRGRDAADLPFEVRENESLANIVVTLTDRVTELRGTVVDAGARPRAGQYVIVFPTDRAYWLPDVRRFPAPVRSATDGKFSFSGLPAGEYYAAATAESIQQELITPAYLERLVKSATKLTLTPGDKKAINVTSDK